MHPLHARRALGASCLLLATLALACRSSSPSGATPAAPASASAADSQLAALAPQAAAPAESASAAGDFERRMQVEVEGQRLRYRLHLPPAAERPSAGWPLLLFLHGAGERGDDLRLVAVHGPPKRLEQQRELASCVLVSPQCPADEWWRASTLMALLDEVRADVEVDPARLYVSGLSMGGYGTWQLLARYPELFAAAVPICGGGDPARLGHPDAPGDGFDLEGLLRARAVPLRVFHGANDLVVPPEESRRLVRALEAVDADVQLTIYPGCGHDSWSRTYADPALYAWMFAQRRASR